MIEGNVGLVAAIVAAKDGVSVKIVIGVLLFAGACASAAIFAEDRYAKTKDLKVFIQQSKKETKQAADILRKQLLEDKKFEFDLIPDKQKSDIQRAMSQRTATQLQEVQNRISALEQDK